MCRFLFNVLLVPMKNLDYIKIRGCMYFACLIYFCWILTFCLHRTWEYASCSPSRKSLAFILLCLHWQDIFDTCLAMQTDTVEEALFEHSSPGSQSPELHCFWSHLLHYGNLNVPECLAYKPAVHTTCHRWKMGSQIEEKGHGNWWHDCDLNVQRDFYFFF